MPLMSLPIPRPYSAITTTLAPVNPGAEPPKTRAKKSKKCSKRKSARNLKVLEKEDSVTTIIGVDEGNVKSSRGLNVHAPEFYPFNVSADTCNDISAAGVETAGPRYVCHPPLPFHCVMEEVDGELWPAGYPRNLCQWGPGQVVVPLLCREANYNVVFVPILAYQAIYNAGEVYLPIIIIYIFFFSDIMTKGKRFDEDLIATFLLLREMKTFIVQHNCGERVDIISSLAD
ncbi:hypothetical protein HDU67_009650 [Dinochytrium kinnereticum]|nr:hypothetical protein HDU67_009650 [Dinochytrium kinnereticum]